jgi:alanine or glycine:cation symporter, AGCS family
MDLLYFFERLNADFLATPATILFFGVAVILTFKTRFMQLRGFPRFISLITSGISRKRKYGEHGEVRTINPFHALFTAMSTAIGMGSVVGPSVAIMLGGPGALFWLLLYIVLGSVTKFTEAAFALATRIQLPDGKIVGGPMQYLKKVSPFLAIWYAAAMSVLLAGWTGLQSNTLANIFALEGFPEWSVGFSLAALVLVVLNGGAKRVGALASKLVPFMFCLYVFFALFILLQDIPGIMSAIRLVAASIFSPAAAIGGFTGATMFQAIRSGMLKGIFMTESGLGTSSIPHAVADTKKPSDQGILAMYSGFADATLAAISGLLILVTGVWAQGAFRSTLIYEAFKLQAPRMGQYALLVSISLFIFTTALGNSFNGSQAFASLTKDRWIKGYIAFVMCVIITGALMPVPLVWEMMDTVLFFVAIPNLVGILILAFREPEVLKL